MTSIAIITARGGSKRIPKKNIKEFYGKPIIAYSIESALKSEIFDEVMVSTDSEEIAEVARRYGASVPFLRTKENSNDFATTADVLIEVIGEYKRRGILYDTIGCIYPTAPFVTASKLTEAMKTLKRTEANCIMTVVQYSFPPQRAFVIREHILKYQYPEYERTRSQDLEPVYHDCGQFYIIRTEALLKAHSLIVPNTIPYLVSNTEVQDIDTISDWAIAETKYIVWKNSRGDFIR